MTVTFYEQEYANTAIKAGLYTAWINSIDLSPIVTVTFYVQEYANTAIKAGLYSARVNNIDFASLCFNADILKIG